MEQPTGDAEVVVFTAGQAAQQLEVSASGLRRLANAYESVFGDLPREPGTQARGYPEEAVERIRAARRGVEVGQYKSTQAALGALKRGVSVDAGAEEAVQPDASQSVSGQALRVLVAEMQAMRTEIERVRIMVEERDRAQLSQNAPRPATEYGPLVRAAMWLEALWRRSRRFDLQRVGSSWERALLRR